MAIEEKYLAWLKDAHAMEKQAESRLEKMAGRLEHYPQLKSRIEEHIQETRKQQSLVQSVIDRFDTSHSVLKDGVGKIPVLAQTVGGMLADDEVLKDVLRSYASVNFEIARYSALISAAELIGDDEGIRVFEQIRNEEIHRADWLLLYLPDLTDDFMLRSSTDGVIAKSKPAE